MWFVLGICDPTCLCSIKDCVIPRLNVKSESVDVYVPGSGLEAPITAFVKIDVVEEDDDLGRGDKRACKVDAFGGRGVEVRSKVTHVIASQELQIGRGDIERVGNATVKSGVVPCSGVVIGGSSGDVLYRHFGTDVGIVAYVEITNANGKTGRGDKWTSEMYPSKGLRLRFVARTDGLGLKLANGRHQVFQEM